MNLSKNARRCALALAVPTLLVSVAACGSGGSKSDASSDGSNGAVASVSGAFGKAPAVKTNPKQKAATNTVVKTISKGSGAEVKKGEYVVLDAMARSYAKPQALLNTYQTMPGKKVPSQIFEQVGAPAGQTALGAAKANSLLAGQKVGSRVLIQGTAKSMFGSMYQQMGAKANDVFDWVVDIHNAGGADVKPTAEVSGKQAAPQSGMPKVTVPSQPAKLVAGAQAKTDEKKVAKFDVKGVKAGSKTESQVLIKGKGPEVKAGDGLLTQYTGALISNGKVFDSSWKHNGLTGFQIGTGAVIQGWDQALVGKHVGDRVLMTVPKKYAYPDKPNPQQPNPAAQKDLTFVVDIVSAVPHGK